MRRPRRPAGSPPRAHSRSRGFSQKIALPARAPAWINSACVSVEVAITIAVTPGRPGPSRGRRRARRSRPAGRQPRRRRRRHSAGETSRRQQVAAMDPPDPARAEHCEAGIIGPCARPVRSPLERVADDERLREAERGRQRAELPHFGILGFEHDVGVARDRRESRVGDGDARASAPALSRRLGGLLGIGPETDRNQEVASAPCRSVDEHAGDAVDQVGALVIDVTQCVGKIGRHRERTPQTDDVDGRRRVDQADRFLEVRGGPTA